MYFLLSSMSQSLCAAQSSSAPPVPDDYCTDCHQQHSTHPYISCRKTGTAHGNFTLIQCHASVCYCVDPVTGVRPVGGREVPHAQMADLDCTAELNKGDCPSLCVRTLLLSSCNVQGLLAKSRAAATYATMDMRWMKTAAQPAIANV